MVNYLVCFCMNEQKNRLLIRYFSFYIKNYLFIYITPFLYPCLYPIFNPSSVIL